MSWRTYALLNNSLVQKQHLRHFILILQGKMNGSRYYEISEHEVGTHVLLKINTFICVPVYVHIREKEYVCLCGRAGVWVYL